MMSTRISAEAYTHLLTPEYWAFIQRVTALFPDDFSKLAVVSQRAAYNEVLRQLGQPLPAKLRVEDQILNTSEHSMMTRRYHITDQASNPAVAQLVYFHGGGFCQK